MVGGESSSMFSKHKAAQGRKTLDRPPPIQFQHVPAYLPLLPPGFPSATSLFFRLQGKTEESLQVPSIPSSHM